MPGWMRKRRQEQEPEGSTRQNAGIPSQTDNTRRQEQLQETSSSDSASSGSALGGLSQLFGGLKDRLTVPPTEEEVVALQAIRAMLSSDKLGGSDGTFNHGDLDAVIDGLKQDHAGLSQEIQQHLLDSGKPLQARMAGRAMGGGRGPLKRMVRRRIDSESSTMLRDQLDQGLTTAGVSPESGAVLDTEPRSLTFEELRAFQQHAAVLQGMQARVEEKLGLGVDFPGGISQDSVEHTLSGKLGVPPGGRLKQPEGTTR
jgi:hypothetical protein